MHTKLAAKFNSIKEWKNYCFNAHSLYIKNPHFRKWINKKDIHLFNFSNLIKENIKCIKSGIEDAIKCSGLHFKVSYENGSGIKKVINLANGKINSDKLLKMVLKKRRESHKEQANIFIFNAPIKSSDALIKDGGALTYVSEGITIFSFDIFKKYPHSFLMRRAKHEALHLLGLNSHHEDIKIKDYNNDILCNMNYNAPTQRLCLKCKGGLISFWEGVEYATKTQFIKS